MGLNINYYGNRDSVIQLRDLAKEMDYISGTGVKVEIGYDEIAIINKAEEDLTIVEEELEAQINYVLELEDKNKDLESSKVGLEIDLERKEWEIEELKKELKKELSKLKNK